MRLQIFLDDELLPLGVEWYDIEGTRVFPLYSKDGALLTDRAAYLIENRPPKELKAAGIRFTLGEIPKLTRSQLKEKVKEAMARLESIDPNGGPLPKVPDST